MSIASTPQSDATRPGDAGDTFETARVISPTLTALNNRLGSADKDDFYQIDLPIDPTFGNFDDPYKIFVSPVAWPQGASGNITFQLYNPNRTPKGGAVSIQAPTTDATAIDLTTCDLCYLKVTDNSVNLSQLQYSFLLVAPERIYLPLVTR